jgi:hypothetical protein
MDAQELRNLQEAYLGVYIQDDLDERYMPMTKKKKIEWKID